MSTHKYIERICAVAALLTVILAVFFMNAEKFGIQPTSQAKEYETSLFDTSYVHTINIEMDDWDGFLDTCIDEEYTVCDITIDGETVSNVAIRGKGNTSLTQVASYGNDRYSFKIEFDHYDSTKTYYGLDKLSLNNIIQDNTYMKDYLTYQMMGYFGVNAPLCSYVWVTVNGEDWGLFLAVEEPEEAFARRNFGNDHGKLYKPDYRSLNAENADVALRYIDDNPDSYPGIFENAKFKVSEADQKRMIEALKTLSTGEKLETAVNVDEVLRYFTVQVFVMNWDSYLGHTGHNYFLYEENGILSILPWDYNLAFGTYALGMTDPVKDPNILINYPINTPAEGEVMLNRPLYHNLMKHDEYFARYHAYFDKLLSEYFESGRFAVTLRQTAKQIAPYVQKDPTAFCSYEDHQLAVDTLEEVCLLRAESIRGQLDGEIPATIRGQAENPDAKVDASVVKLTDLGDFEDLESAKERQDAALRDITGKST